MPAPTPTWTARTIPEDYPTFASTDIFFSSTTILFSGHSNGITWNVR